MNIVTVIPETSETTCTECRGQYHETTHPCDWCGDHVCVVCEVEIGDELVCETCVGIEDAA